jgi:hypothetical protein
MVMKINFTPGIDRFNCRPASSPFNNGMPMSSTMTSG